MENEIKEYSNSEITVLWEASKCIHSGKCVHNLSQVFQPKEKPWIKINNAESQEIVNAVAKCPSGALTIKID